MILFEDLAEIGHLWLVEPTRKKFLILDQKNSISGVTQKLDGGAI